MIGLPAPFYIIDVFFPLSLFLGLCPQRSPGTEDDRPPPSPAPCRLKRPARAPGNERLTVWQTVRIVWSNIPLSCVVVDSSALSTPAANRSARILDIRFRRASVKTRAFLCNNCLGGQPLAGRQLYALGGWPKTGYFRTCGKITCDMAGFDLIFRW